MVSVANQEKVDVKLLVSSVGCLQHCGSGLSVNALYEMSSRYPLLDFVGYLTDNSGV